MKDSNDKPKSNTGRTFVDHQRAIDTALNERKKDSNVEQPEGDDAESEKRTKTDVSHKKTGGGKQVSPGD